MHADRRNEYVGMSSDPPSKLSDIALSGADRNATVMVGRDRKRRTIGIYPDINLQEARAKGKRIDALLLNSVSGVVDEGHIGRLHFRVECRVEFVEIAAPSAPVRRVGDARRQEIQLVAASIIARAFLETNSGQYECRTRQLGAFLVRTHRHQIPGRPRFHGRRVHAIRRVDVRREHAQMPKSPPPRIAGDPRSRSPLGGMYSEIHPGAQSGAGFQKGIVGFGFSRPCCKPDSPCRNGQRKHPEHENSPLFKRAAPRQLPKEASLREPRLPQ